MGESLELVALICRRSDLQAALVIADRSGRTTPGQLVETVLALAARTGSGCSYHHVGTASGALSVHTPEVLSPSPDTVSVVVPQVAMCSDALAGGSPGCCSGARRHRQPIEPALEYSFASRSVVPLELVFDARHRRLLLASPLAPVSEESFPQRVVIGGIDGSALPGTDAVVADGSDLHRVSPTPDLDILKGTLGYFPRGALNDCTSLFDRAELGKAMLRRRFGLDVAHLPVPGAELGLMMYRMPGPDSADGDPVTSGSELDTSLVQVADGDRFPTVFTHPDALGLAYQAGRQARPGPAIATVTGPQLRPLHAPFGVVGFARVHPRWGDVAEVDALGCWSGLAPSTDRVPLLRWDSDEGPRYTTVGRPLTPSGAPDHSARFVHTVGLVRPAPPINLGESGKGGADAGVVSLFEWYHRRRRVWFYGTEPDEQRQGGFQRIAVVGGLDVQPGPAHVALLRSRARRGGARLHVVSVEAGRSPLEQLAGFVLGAWPGSMPDEQARPYGSARSTSEEFEQIHPIPWPGSWPVFEMHRPGDQPCRTTEPGPLLRGGSSVGAVVGYVPERGHGEPQIAWLRAALNLPPVGPPTDSDSRFDLLRDGMGTSVTLVVGRVRRAVRSVKMRARSRMRAGPWP